MTELSNLQLPPSLLADLYRDTLVENASPDREVSPVVATPPAKNAAPQSSGAQGKIPYLGKNRQGILLLVDYSDQVYLPEAPLQFLTSILQACHLDLGDVAIINRHGQHWTLDDLQAALDFRVLLLFGAPLTLLGGPAGTDFEARTLGPLTQVSAPALEALNNASSEGKLLKSKLWLCLKQIFKI